MALELGEVNGRTSSSPAQPGGRSDFVCNKCCPYRRATDPVRLRVHTRSASYSFISLSRAAASSRSAPVLLSR
jgi:hypothetical protein